MAKKTIRTRPPIKESAPIKAQPQVVEQPLGLASARDFYKSAEERISMLPRVSPELSVDRIQATFAHMLMMNTSDLAKMNSMLSSLSVFEAQCVRLMVRSLRDLPPKYENTLDEKGAVIYERDGKPRRHIVSLHPDALQNEKQALEISKYMHERAFGKAKVTIEHNLPPQTNKGQITTDMILQAMGSLPKTMVDVLASSSIRTIKKEANG